MIKDASLTEGVAQCTTDLNSSSKIADHTDYLQAFVLFLKMFVFIQKTNMDQLLMIIILIMIVLYLSFLQHRHHCILYVFRSILQDRGLRGRK